MKIGNYSVIKKIAEGGFGRIYEAKHEILGTKACLKQNKNDSKEEVDMLVHEAKLMWNLNEYHSIPSIKDLYVINKGSAVMVTSLIEGRTLEEIVADKGAIHPEDASWITERLLGALYYAHCNGVIHSDIKPENVFIEPEKRDIKLIDFGLATYKPTSGSRAMGYTPKYAAPELLQNLPPIPETDLYGAGIVMLRALGGDVDKKTFRSDTPKEIVEFCNSLLRYNPKERPNWKKSNPIEQLSDIREKVFGRRHITGTPMKGGIN